MARLVSAKDLYVLQVAVVIVLLWVAIWNLVEIAIDKLEARLRVSRAKLYGALLVFVLIIIIFDPYIFEKL